MAGGSGTSQYRHVVATSRGDVELRAVSGAQQWGRSTVPPPPGDGAAVGALGAVQIAAVYGSVGLLADSVSTLPCRVLDSPILKNAKEIAPSALIQQPYAEMSRIDWWVQFVWSLALRGEFIGLIVERDADLYASQIKPLNVDQVQVRRNRAGQIEYRFCGQLLNIDDVFHVKYQSWPGMIRGLSPIDVLKTTFGLAISQEKYGLTYFQNSANPQGVIQVPGDLDINEAEALLCKWLAGHQGPGRANLPAVLTGDAKFLPTTITPEDSQFLESRGFSAATISGTIFRIPPHMIGLVDRSTSWGTGVEQQEQGYARNTLQGYLSRGEEALTALHPPGQYVSFDLTQRVRGDTLQRAQAVSLLMLAGVIVGDEGRALFDMPALPDGQGQNLFTPINTELLQQALAQVTAANAAANNPQLLAGGQS